VTDEEIIEFLRNHQPRTPIELAEILKRHAPAGLTASSLVTYFRRAFPTIPLLVLRRAGLWNRFCQGGMTDEDFDRMLLPWLKDAPRRGTPEPDPDP
jgi:hypothetical protein